MDPGLTGAVAFIPDGASPFVVDMPVFQVSETGFVKNALDSGMLARVLRANTSGFDLVNAVAVLERVSAFPGQGVASMFSLGMSYWGAYSTLVALDIPVTLVEPKEWKGFYRLQKDKAESISLARRLFPGVELGLKRHHGRAEALLIAQYGKSRQEKR